MKKKKTFSRYLIGRLGSTDNLHRWGVIGDPKLLNNLFKKYYKYPKKKWLNNHKNDNIMFYHFNNEWSYIKSIIGW